MNGRLPGAILAVRQAVATATGIPLESVSADEDLILDVCLDVLERESLGLIIDEIFGVIIPEEIYRSPLYRTPEAMAEWIIARSEGAEWAEARQQRKRV